MKRLMLTLLFTSSLSFLHSQVKKKIPCTALESAVNSKIFKDHFAICGDNTNDLIVIDTSNIFNDCFISPMCSRNIKFENRHGGVDMKNKNIILLYKGELKKNVYILYFIRPYTGATIKFFLKHRKGKIRDIKFEWGAA